MASAAKAKRRKRWRRSLNGGLDLALRRERDERDVGLGRVRIVVDNGPIVLVVKLDVARALAWDLALAPERPPGPATICPPVASGEGVFALEPRSSPRS